MTIVVNVEDAAARAGHQAAQQADQRAQDRRARARRASVQRELLLVKVRADSETRSQVARDRPAVPRQGRRRRARTRSPSRPPATATSSTRCCEMLEPFGIKELVQSGMVAIGRGARSITDRALRCRSPTDARTALGRRSETRRPRRRPHTTHHRTQGETRQWPRCSTTTTPTCPSSRAARSRSSATAARATPTRCRCATPASTCASVCPRAPSAGRRPRTQGLRVVTPAEARAEADVIMILVPDPMQRQRLRRGHRAEPERRRRAVLRPRLQHPLRLHQAAGRRRRRAWSRPRARATWCAASTRRAAACPCLVAVEQDATGKAWRARPVLRQGHRRHPGRRASRPRSPRRPRPTCSASRPCSAAARPRWSRPASRRWSRPATSPRSPTSSACTS